MNRTVGTVVVVAALVVAAVVGSAGALGATAGAADSRATSTPFAQEGGNETNTTEGVNTTGTADDGNASDGDGSTFGATVSSFMQASAAEAEAEVETGMFDARFERSNATEQARLVRSRASTIGERIAELREERERLLSQPNVTVRERAQAARLAARADGLRSSIDEVERKAERSGTGLNATALDTLRTDATNLTGPEVADLAADLIDRDRERGRPEDTPGQGPDAEDRGPDDGADAANGSDSAGEAGQSGERGGNGPDSADAPGGPGDQQGGADESRTPEPTESDDGSDDENDNGGGQSGNGGGSGGNPGNGGGSGGNPSNGGGQGQN